MLDLSTLFYGIKYTNYTSKKRCIYNKQKTSSMATAVQHHAVLYQLPVILTLAKVW